MELNRNQQLAAIALLGLGLIGLSFGLFRPRGVSGHDGGDIKITEPGKSPARDVDISVEEAPARRSPANPDVSILVHVAGRVKFPNVYRVPPGSRVIDAVKAAGGSLSDANLDAVNLAARIKDGDKILIPSRNVPRAPVLPMASGRALSFGPSAAPTAAGSVESASSGKLAVPGQGFVNINTADSSELQRLPGVGPSTAQKIIDYRTQIGSFSSIDQLLEVKGIGSKKIEKIRPFVGL
ncbi:MAG: helix-hairpin-helix domain-containing protein [Armatimonadota bacterium]|nr:helix-hairpin-helix domain-containing protein [Armatimonadota bacterium]